MVHTTNKKLAFPLVNLGKPADPLEDSRVVHNSIVKRFTCWGAWQKISRCYLKKMLKCSLSLNNSFGLAGLRFLRADLGVGLISRCYLIKCSEALCPSKTVNLGWPVWNILECISWLGCDFFKRFKTDQALRLVFSLFSLMGEYRKSTDMRERQAWNKKGNIRSQNEKRTPLI